MNFRTPAMVALLCLASPLALQAQNAPASLTAQIQANPSDAAQLLSQAIAANPSQAAALTAAAVTAAPGQVKALVAAAVAAVMKAGPLGTAVTSPSTPGYNAAMANAQNKIIAAVDAVVNAAMTAAPTQRAAIISAAQSTVQSVVQAAAPGSSGTIGTASFFVQDLSVSISSILIPVAPLFNPISLTTPQQPINPTVTSPSGP